MINIEVLQEIDNKLNDIHIHKEHGNYYLNVGTSKNDCLKIIDEIKELLETTRIERNLEIKENKL